MVNRDCAELPEMNKISLRRGLGSWFLNGVRMVRRDNIAISFGSEDGRKEQAKKSLYGGIK